MRDQSARSCSLSHTHSFTLLSPPPPRESALRYHLEHASLLGFSYPGGLHIIVLLKFDLKLASVCVSSRTGESLIINQLQDLTLVVVVVVTNADGRDASEGVLEAKPA